MPRMCLVLLLAFCSVPAVAQVAVEAGQPPRERDGAAATPEGETAFERISRQAGEMIAGLRQLEDWDLHYALQMDAVRRIYERNGWDSEPDLFSLELMGQVERIPPWNVQERFDTAFSIIGDRYLLDEQQDQVLRALVLRENQKLFTKHAGRIMQYAMEAIQTRAAGEPFTAEQVARWTRLAEPVLRDSRQAITSAAQEFMQHLDPEQRELLQSDLLAANRRLDTVEQMTASWKRGEWDPSQWGLEEDPIQNPPGAADLAARREPPAAGDETDQPAPPGHAAARDGRAGAGGDGARAATPAAGDAAPRPQAQRETAASKPDGPDDEWARYVREFIARYALLDAQQQKAWLFYKDARKRADAMDERFNRQTANMSADDERAAARLEALRARRQSDQDRLFGRLKERLETLPTRAQRRASEARGGGDGEKPQSKAAREAPGQRP